MSVRIEVGLVLYGVALLFPVQRAVDAHRGQLPELIHTLPPDSILPVLALGYGETASDLLEIQATNYMMNKMDTQELNKHHLRRLFMAILALDPHNTEACWRAGIYTSSLTDSPQAALDILARGLGEPFGPDRRTLPGAHPEHPYRWRLYYEQGAIHFLMLVNRAATPAERQEQVRRAGELFMLASHQPNGPATLGSVGRKLVDSTLGELGALELEWELWRRRAQQELGKEQALQRARQAEAALKRAVLQREVDRRAKAGSPVTSLDALLDRLKPEALVDPLGLGFFLRDGVVLAPALEARVAEEQLQRLFERRERRLGHPPATFAELQYDPKQLAPYLRATLSEEGVQVTAEAPRSQ